MSISDIITELIKVKKCSKQNLYQLVTNKRKEYNYLITARHAAALLAGENGIDLERILSAEELNEIRNIKGIQINTVVKQTTKNEKKDKDVQLTLNLPKGIKIEDPILPKSIVDDSLRMANTYLMIYLFENSVRNLIKSVLESKYGQSWWDSNVSKSVKDTVEKRISEENENLWHGKRGAHPIFYTDIAELNSIISKNWDDFKDIIKKEQTWIKHKIEEIKTSRNVMAHNNPLTNDDIQRIEVNFKDWFKQIGSYDIKR